MTFEVLRFLLILFSLKTMEYYSNSLQFVKGESKDSTQNQTEIVWEEVVDSSFGHVKSEHLVRNKSESFHSSFGLDDNSSDDPQDEPMWKRDGENATEENSTDYFYTFNIEDIEEFIYPKTWTWILISFHLAVFLVGIVGNFLVCVAVYRNHTMRTVTNYFIVNLALADFLVIIFCLPPTVVWDVTMTWFFGVFMCKLVLFFQNVSVTVSILTLTFISIDRWYAICFPLKFKSTTGRAKTAIGIIWFLSLSTCKSPLLSPANI